MKACWLVLFGLIFALTSGCDADQPGHATSKSPRLQDASLKTGSEPLASSSAPATSFPSWEVVWVWNGETPTVPPSPEEAERQVRRMEGMRKVLGNTPPPHVPQRDEVILGKVRYAQDVLKSMTATPQLAKLWHREEVLRVAASLGTDTPLLEPPSGSGEAALAVYSVRQDVVYVWPEAARLTPLEMQRLLMHTATQAVVRREILSRAGWSADTYVAWQHACMDVAVIFNFATEALAFRNEAMLLEARRGSEPTPLLDTHTFILEHATHSESGSSRDRWMFGKDVVKHVMQTAVRGSPGLGAGQESSACGLPVFAAGERFNPFILAPEFLVPLWQAANRKSP